MYVLQTYHGAVGFLMRSWVTSVSDTSNEKYTYISNTDDTAELMNTSQSCLLLSKQGREWPFGAQWSPLQWKSAFGKRSSLVKRHCLLKQIMDLLCVCVYTCVYTCVYVFELIHMYVWTFTHTHVCVRVATHTHTHACMHTHTVRPSETPFLKQKSQSP